MSHNLLMCLGPGPNARGTRRSGVLTAMLILVAGASAHAQLGGSLFNGDLDPFNKNNKLGGNIDLPRIRTPQESTSGLTVITGPSMDRDGYIAGGSSRSDYHQSRVGRGELRFDAEGRAWWHSGYSNSYGRVNSPVRAFPKYDRVVQVRREREQRAAEERQRQEDRRREQEQRAIQERQRREQARRQQEQQEIARGVAGLVDSLTADAQRRRADRQAWEMMQRREAQRPAWMDEMPRTDDGPSPGSAAIGPPTGVFFASNLGLHYEMDRYQDGTFGARVVRPPAVNSPAARLGFEPGDVIFALDDQRFRMPADVLNHRGPTSVNFVDVRGGTARSANFFIP